MVNRCEWCHERFHTDAYYHVCGLFINGSRFYATTPNLESLIMAIELARDIWFTYQALETKGMIRRTHGQ